MTSSTRQFAYVLLFLRLVGVWLIGWSSFGRVPVDAYGINIQIDICAYFTSYKSCANLPVGIQCAGSQWQWCLACGYGIHQGQTRLVGPFDCDTGQFNPIPTCHHVACTTGIYPWCNLTPSPNGTPCGSIYECQNGKCVNTDPCRYNFCQNGATCVKYGASYSCSCKYGWSGTYCTTDINMCSPNPCNGHGSCADWPAAWGAPGYTCSCYSGYTGSTCASVIDRCGSSPCVRGTCKSCGLNCYTCNNPCPTGYTGTYCTTDINECSPNPCLNGASCYNGIGYYSCTCKAGYTGSTCATNINDCSPNPCYNGGSCTDGVASYTCSCKAGYSGSRCQTNINDCVSGTCPHGTCVDGVNTYTCTNCHSGWSGTYCNNIINYCLPNPCLNGGSCTYCGLLCAYCTCPAGYSGGTCQTNINDCSPNPCAHSVSGCTDLVNDFSCGTCALGWEGKRCNVDSNDCPAGRCPTGNCIDLGTNSYSCNNPCHSGYTGWYCNQDIDDCSPNPCTRGTCSDPGITPNTYTCSCPAGWQGKNCDQDINDCSPNPCQSGTCYDDGAVAWHCSPCAAGWTGQNCNVDYDECSSNPCKNGGVCTDHPTPGVQSFTCACCCGYDGPICTGDADDCVSNNCQHGSTCFDNGILSYGCACLSGYSGNYCEIDIDDCASGPCVHGSCSDAGPDRYSCSCSAGWQGVRCDTDINDCGSNPCQNGGVCRDNGWNQYYECSCVSGYVGHSCETDYNDCTSNPCPNAIQCRDAGPNAFTCPPCKAGWQGELCNIDIDDCLSGPCVNGGSCTDNGWNQNYECTCPTGWTGKNCHLDYDECLSAPCLHGGTCVHLGFRAYKCLCDGTGWEGSICQTDVNDCLSNPCWHGGICSDAGTHKFACNCVGTAACWEGHRCENDKNDCASTPCLHGSTCINHEECAYSCECGSTGYKGVTCEIDIDDCISNPCQHGGSCVDDGPNRYDCTCVTGWTGYSCELDYDDCLSNPCKFGSTCTDRGFNLYTCDCGSLGYKGYNCDIDIDDCVSGPCINGVCSDAGPNAYNCDCTGTGFKGKNCQTDIDDCESNPCQHGTPCRDDGPNRYDCDCGNSGWQGYSCEVDIDDCLSLPCANGVCIDSDLYGKNKFFCECGTTGFKGTLCETDIDDCESQPCIHGHPDRITGCKDTGPNSFYCDCYKTHFIGETCELDANECAYGEEPDYNFDVVFEIEYPTALYGKDRIYVKPVPLHGNGAFSDVFGFYGSGEGLLGGNSRLHDKFGAPDGFTQMFTVDQNGDLQYYVLLDHDLSNSGGRASLSVDAWLSDTDRWEYCGITALVFDDDDDLVAFPKVNYWQDSGGFGQYQWAWSRQDADGIVLGSFPPIKDNCWKSTFTGLEGVTFQGSFAATYDPDVAVGDDSLKNMDAVSMTPKIMLSDYEYKICVRDAAPIIANKRNECSSDPCQDGTVGNPTGPTQCVNHLGYFQCICDDDHKGKFCEILTNMCLSAPCVNGGVCNRNGDEDYLCDCNAVDYFGRDCEHYDACVSSPCENGGSCTRLVNSLYECTCPEGFAGLECEIVTGECAGTLDASQAGPEADVDAHDVQSVLVMGFDMDGAKGHAYSTNLASFLRTHLGSATLVTHKYVRSDRSGDNCFKGQFHLYDQVYLVDAGSTKGEWNDKARCMEDIAAWYALDPSREVVLDGNGNSVLQSNDLRLYANVYDNFRLKSGGLYLSCQGRNCVNINRVLTELNFDVMLRDNGADSTMFVDTTRALMQIPKDAFTSASPLDREIVNGKNLDGYINVAERAARVPVGVQPNGRTLHAVGYLVRSGSYEVALSTTLNYVSLFHVAACSPAADPPQTTCNDDVNAQGTVVARGVYPYDYSWWFFPESESSSYATIDDSTPTANRVATDISFSDTMANLLAGANADANSRYVLRFHAEDGRGDVSDFDVNMLVLDPTGTFPSDVALYPFGVCAGDTALPRGDSPNAAITTPFGLQYYHTVMSTTMHINTDGILSFNAPFTSFVSSCLGSLLRGPLIAPFYGDVDTTTSRGRVVSYRDSLSDASLLTTATDDINEYYFKGVTTDFTATYVFVATWDAVGRSSGHGEVLNTFQVVLVADVERTFAMFNYPEGGVNWLQGDSGFDAQAGFAFDSSRFTVASGAACGAATDVDAFYADSNCGFPGRHVFRLDRFDGVLPPVTDDNIALLSDSTMASIEVVNAKPYTWKTDQCGGTTLSCTIEFEPAHEFSKFDFVARTTATDSKITDEKSRVVISGQDKTGTALAANVYTFTVTSGDGQFTTTYTVNIFVNKFVWLDTLTLTGLDTPTNDGDIGVGYSPIVFNPLRHTYTTTVTSDYIEMNVACTATGWFVDPTITSESATSGFFSTVTSSYSQDHDLDYLTDTEVEITVTEYEGFTKTYLLTVTMTPSHDIRLLPVSTTVFSSVGTVTGSGSAFFVDVPSDTGTLDVTTETNHLHASVAINGGPLTEQTDTQPVIDIPLGDTVVPISVQAEDGYTTALYTLTISRPPSTNTELSSIVIDCDACDNGLSGFSSATYAYTVHAEHWVTDVAFTASQGHFDIVTGLPSATVTMNAVAVTHNVQTSALSLGTPDSSSPSFVYTFTVVAQDGVTSQDYVVTVVQDTPPSVGSISLASPDIDQSYPIGFEQNRYFYFTLAEDVDFLHLFARGNGGAYSAPALALSKNTGACTPVTCSDLVFNVRQLFESEYYYQTVMFAKAGDYVVHFTENDYMTTVSGDAEYNVDFSIRVGDRAALPPSSAPAAISVEMGTVALFASDTGGAEFDSLGIEALLLTGTPAQQVHVTAVDVVNELGASYDASALLLEEVFPPHTPSKNPVDSTNEYLAQVIRPDASSVAFFLVFADPNAADTSASYSMTVGDTTPVPVIVSVSPGATSPMGGTKFTITGSGFDPLASTPTGDVLVGGVAATGCTYNSARQIVCSSPKLVGTNHAVTVEINGVSSAAADQKIRSYYPSISGIVPGDSAKPTDGGYLLTINGANFGDDSLATPEVLMTDGATCTTVTVTSTNKQLTCTVSEVVGGELGVNVRLAGLTSGPRKFITFAPPQITDIGYVDNGSGVPTTYTVTGANFGSSAADVTVVVGGTVVDGADIVGKTHGYMELTNQDVRTLITIEVEGAIASWQFLAECNDDCPPGWYNDTVAFEGCLECPAGTYRGSAGAQGVESCLPCAEGYFGPVAGATECIICPAGFYNGLTEQSSCTICPSGDYCPEGATASSGCLAGSFSSVEGQADCLLCTPGSYNTGTGNTECIACSGGMFNNLAGSTTCSDCPAGQFAYEEGSTLCETCVPGSFTATAGEGSCDLCVTGSIGSDYAATTCVECSVGEIAAASGLAVCEKCAVGSVAASEGLDVCTECDPGWYAETAGLASCSACPIGQYQPASGQAGCFPCEPGTFADSIGSSNCTLCPAGSYSTAGASKCTLCDFGTFGRDQGQSECVSCSVGQFAGETGKTACDDCAAGTIAPTVGLASCDKCTPGHYAPFEGLAICTECPLGQYQSNNGASECIRCPAGMSSDVSAATGCTACAAGEITNLDGMTECRACPAGASTNTLTGQTACTDCEIGTYQPAGQTSSCADCSPGKFMDERGATECFPCFPGTFIATNKTVTCEQCAPGTYQPAQGKRQCISCGIGTFSSQYGQKQCTQCPAGYFQTSPGTTFCSACGVGEYQNVRGETTCVACPVGRYNAELGQSVCASCEAGSFQELENTTSCDLCPVHYHQPLAGMTQCDICEDGTENLIEGASVCRTCLAGYFSNNDTDFACTPCGVGEYQPSEGSSECKSCPVGSYGDIKQAVSCTLCPVGMFQNETGTTVCVDCAPGKYNAMQGATACRACAAGSFGRGSGQSRCEKCPLGMHMAFEGNTECDVCPAGTYADENSDGTLCTECPSGTFGAVERATHCTRCPAGYRAQSTGSTACEQCGPGTANDQTGAHDCTPCDRGEFADSRGRLTCSRCEAGRFTNNTATLHCQLCAKGSYQPAEAQFSCPLCDIGYFAEDTGQLECEPCEKGFFASKVGSVNCTMCPEGTAQPRIAQPECLMCPAGKYAGFGFEKCETCRFGEVSTDAGSAFCMPCDDNAIPNAERTRCICAVGFAGRRINGSENSVVCLKCPKGTVCDSPGVEWDSMATARGWWRADNSSDTNYYQCPYEHYCTGGLMASSREQCGDNRIGPLCAQCKVGHNLDFDGNCVPCMNDGVSFTVFILVMGCALAALLLQLFLLLRAARPLTEAALKEDADKRSEAHGFLNETHGAWQDFDRDQRFGGVLTVEGPPKVRPDFTYKLKIVIGFVQIITNLSVGLDIQWPVVFTTFVEWFNFFNLDMARLSGADCVVDDVNYFYSLYFWGVFPPVVIVLLLLIYLLPIYIFNPVHNAADAHYQEEGHDRQSLNNRATGVRNFWRLSLFSLFLVYPTISSTVLRTFVCVQVEGVYYLRADFSVQCYTDSYAFPQAFAAICTLLYPIGIPLVMFLKLYWHSRRDELNKKGTRAKLGFLYDGYERNVWWFETLDMGCKLAMTSLIAFVPFEYQMLVAMVLCAFYIMVIEQMQPYIRKADNRLHMIALVEILMMLMAGNVFNQLEEPDELMDVVLSVVLIGIVIGFFAWWVITTANVALKLLNETKNPCVHAFLDSCCCNMRKGERALLEEHTTEIERQKALAARANEKHRLYDGQYAVARSDLRSSSKAKFGDSSAVVHNMARNALHADHLGEESKAVTEFVEPEWQAREAEEKAMEEAPPVVAPVHTVAYTDHDDFDFE